MKPVAVTLCAALVLAACETDLTPPDPLVTIDDELRLALTGSGWGGAVPVGSMSPLPSAQVELGRALFFDKILSGNKDVACATCHHPSTALADGLSLSVGTGGTGLGPSRALGPGRELVPRSAPTLLNVGLGMRYLLWDGRVGRFGPGVIPTTGGNTETVTSDPVVTETTAVPPGGAGLVAQAFLPVLDRREMRGEPGDTDAEGRPNELAAFADDQHVEIWAAIMDRLVAIPEYVQMFGAAFPETPADQLRYEHAARALAAFETGAFTMTRSPFDRYLDGDDAALTLEQKRGALLFLGEAGCSRCHGGPFLGGQGFHNVGAPQVGPGVRREPPLDLGVGEIEDNDWSRFTFRVPPLRNVELTAPYTHSGAYATLDAVVRHYDDVPEAMRTYDVTQLDPALRDMHHGDEAVVAEVLETLEWRLREPLDLEDGDIADLVAFLRSLTDPAARDLDHLVPARVPSGLPVDR